MLLGVAAMVCGGSGQPNTPKHDKCLPAKLVHFGPFVSLGQCNLHRQVLGKLLFKLIFFRTLTSFLGSSDCCAFSGHHIQLNVRVGSLRVPFHCPLPIISCTGQLVACSCLLDEKSEKFNGPAGRAVAVLTYSYPCPILTVCSDQHATSLSAGSSPT